MAEISTSSKVFVYDKASGKKAFFALGSNGNLGLKTLRNIFPDAVGLIQEEDGALDFSLAFDGDNILAPEGQWDGKKFRVVLRRAPQSTPAQVGLPSTPTELFPRRTFEQGSVEIMSYWTGKFFRVKGARSDGFGVLVDSSQILTFAHLGFNLQQTYEATNDYGKKYSVECVFINKRLDIAMLKNEELPSLPLGNGSLFPGSACLFVYYPAESTTTTPSIIQGKIEGMCHDKIHLTCSFETIEEYSNGVVFNYNARLGGILSGPVPELNSDETKEDECPAFSKKRKLYKILELSTIAAARAHFPTASSS
uniref:TAR DNA-binding protein 43 N-terminal domain-containing protein n=1 Tax=Panagrolaimus sp. JU765 TaxID=591449 RepID=A0AC34QS67_9BILA